MRRETVQRRIALVSAIKLDSSIKNAERRFADRQRKRRVDRGAARIAREVEAYLQSLLQTVDKPSIGGVALRVEQYCAERGLPAPRRSTVYNAVRRARCPEYTVAALPECVRETLYNFEGTTLSGAHVAFHAFNYGSTSALSFASGLPWLCLVQASERRGWRPKSLSLLRAVMSFRGIQ